MERPDWFNEDLYPFESHWQEVNGAQVHYLDEGEGPTLLMLHGNPTWSFLYRRMVPYLSDRFRCIALDYPGFGLSTAPDGYGFTPAEHASTVSGLIDALGLDEFTPIMQDWGGPIGLSVALDRPDQIKAIILGNTWAWPQTDALTQRFASALGEGRTGEFLVDRANVFVNVFLRRAMRRRSPSGREMDMWRGPFLERDSRIAVRVMPRELTGSADFLSDIEARLSEIADRPSLLFWADQDPAFRGADKRRWETILSNRRTYILRHAGHFWQDDAGPEASLMIRYWWDQTFT
ncbi:MAG: alpha/beta fold hydrolase [Actinobacteria bacterium]|nr:alpha/beta fold hydrolase [Actinomycetota bacterium]